MSLFRRREPLHVRLAREGGLEPPPGDPPRPAWDAAGIHGIQRAREWDAVVTVEAPEVEGDRAAWVATDGGDLFVEEGPDTVRLLADALERELRLPYRAEAVRRGDGLWAVAGRRVELVEVAGVEGDEVQLAMHGDERTLTIDGERAFGSIPQLERPEHVVRARRVDGELWEVETAPL